MSACADPTNLAVDFPSSNGESLGAPALWQERFGDFRLIREIGRGGIGVVYEAEQLSLGRRVALKMIPFAPFADKRRLQRFQNEARAAAALDHPHIVKVYSVGLDAGNPFYAMQLIQGRTLAEWIVEMRAAEVSAPDSDAMPAARFRLAAELGIQACAALEHAHSQGVIHRDIKPDNLLVGDGGRFWVTDLVLRVWPRIPA